MSNIISIEEWRRRYAEHIAKRCGADMAFATEVAGAAIESGDHQEFDTPEEAADEELSCWADDEGAID